MLACLFLQSKDISKPGIKCKKLSKQSCENGQSLPAVIFQEFLLSHVEECLFDNNTECLFREPRKSLDVASTFSMETSGCVNQVLIYVCLILFRTWASQLHCPIFQIITTTVVINHGHQIGHKAHKHWHFMTRHGIFRQSYTRVGRLDLGKSS